MESTKIEWATSTFNPWIGCSKVHTGCTNCYAEAMAGRLGVTWGPHGTRRRTSGRYWKQPLKWEREAAKVGLRPRVFPSLCDPLENWPHPIRHHTGPLLTLRDGLYSPGATGYGFRLATMGDLRRDFFALIDQTPHLDWLLLTKRPENIRRMWPGGRRENVWMIYSASDQTTLEAGLPHLLACRDLVPVLGLSLEPLVGPVDVSRWLRLGPCGSADGECTDNSCRTHPLDWVIAGGESGPHARPCSVEWIRSVVKQCRAAGVPCFVKQLGANYHDEVNGVCGLSTQWPYEILPRGPSYRLEDPKGGNPTEWPEELQVRECPQ